MSGYAYLLPQIRILPPQGYRLHDSFSLDAAAQRLIDPRKSVKIILQWQVIRDDKVVEERVGPVVWRDGAWSGRENATYSCSDDDPRSWRDPACLSYLERSAISEDGEIFRNYITEAGYGLYGGKDRRMFLVGATVKFAAPTTIRQIADFGQWVESYPAAESDPMAGFDMSVVLVNPFLKDATVAVEFSGRPERRRIRVPRRSVRRCGIAEMLGGSDPAWRGTIFVSGPNRLITVFVSHAASDPAEIFSIQHSESYRGIEAFEPWTRQMRRRIGMAIKGPGVLGPKP